MTTRQFGLSKSRMAAFEQCPKRLWLRVHRPELAASDDDTDQSFTIGEAIGLEARAQCVGGILVEAEPNLRGALATTKTLLAAGTRVPIFEATLEHDGVLVMVDILEPVADGRWHMAEVKSSGSAKAHHYGDLATQVWVARQAGIEIASAAIRHVDTSFVLQAEGNFRGLFRDTHLLDALAPLTDERGDLALTARQTLTGPEPDLAPGAQCTSPFACEFIEHCHRDAPEGPDWPVTVLPSGGGKRWLEQGIDDLFAVDPALLTSPVHRRVYDATTSGLPYHDVAGAKAAIDSWAYPRTWLDFETIAFVMPRWVGMRPYEQAPFQFSAHIEDAEGKIEHREFLSLGGSDPRRACAEALLEHIPGSGAIIAYNAPFERNCIKGLAAIFPDLADGLRAMADRLVDLLPVTRANWYHRDQRGSWSIKAVLPTVAPHLSYSELDVKDGMQAQLAYMEAADGLCTADRRQAIDAALRAYCQRDTEAMIVLARHLTGNTS